MSNELTNATEFFSATMSLTIVGATTPKKNTQTRPTGDSRITYYTINII